MLTFRAILIVYVVSHVNSFPDLIPEAITVYRNPDFFKNLNYDQKGTQNPTNPPPATNEQYKYPGETHKPNPPGPSFEVNYDNSPEFVHEPRDVFVNTNHKPHSKKGPYSPRYETQGNEEEPYYEHITKPDNVDEEEEESQEQANSEDEEENQEQVDKEDEREDEADKEEQSSSGYEGFRGHPGDDPEDFRSLLQPAPHEEFKRYHEPISLDKESFTSHPNSALSTSTYNTPYAYNRSIPLLYEDWKHYNYPKLIARAFLRSDDQDERLYSEEPASNAFDGSAYSTYNDDYEDDDYRNNPGADTKLIYKKLLKPKKFNFKFQVKPKRKKLKLKVKKGHFHDWYHSYPFLF